MSRPVSFRRPAEDDHAVIVRVIDEWWGGRRLHDLLPRLWLQHFTGTSWVAEDAAGRIVGFLVGFRSPDHPDLAYCHMIATDPDVRGSGLGRALYERFFEDMRGRGVSTVTAITWPGNRASLAFHRSIGFEPVANEGTREMFGTPAFPDYDYDGEDRVVMKRRI